MVESGMFGTFERILDEKNRVVVPARFLAGEHTCFFVTKDLSQSITFRTKEEFAAIRARLEAGNQFNPALRDYMRYFFGQTVEVVVDKAGRVLLPKSFLEHAAIEKEVVFVGVGSRLELFSKKNYLMFSETFANSQALDNLVADLEKQGVKL